MTFGYIYLCRGVSEIKSTSTTTSRLGTNIGSAVPTVGSNPGCLSMKFSIRKKYVLKIIQENIVRGWLLFL